MVNKRLISTIIFWGSAWGIIEATLGNLLHTMNLSIGWLFWFPIAFYIMNKVYKQTGKYEAILYISIIAASLKLIDLLLPVRIDLVLNPAASILVEGLVVFAVFKAKEKFQPSRKLGLFEVTVASLAWRGFYAIYVILLPTWMFSISPSRGLEPLMRFLLLEGGVNALTIFVIVKLISKIRLHINKKDNINSLLTILEKSQSLFNKCEIRPLVSLAVLIVALIFQWTM